MKSSGLVAVRPLLLERPHVPHERVLMIITSLAVCAESMDKIISTEFRRVV